MSEFCLIWGPLNIPPEPPAPFEIVWHPAGVYNCQRISCLTEKLKINPGDADSSGQNAYCKKTGVRPKVSDTQCALMWTDADGNSIYLERYDHGQGQVWDHAGQPPSPLPCCEKKPCSVHVNHRISWMHHLIALFAFCLLSWSSLLSRLKVRLSLWAG